MIEGLVSTIIPVFNRGAMLREAVDSVLAQAWRPIEIIIVDDGSNDDTPAVMEQLCAQHPEIIRLHRQENAGPGTARQSGLRLARGQFIQFLDSDDLLLPDKFALQVAGLRGDPDADIAYGKTIVSELGVRQAGPAQHTGERHRNLFPALLQEPLWPTLTPLYRASALVKVGPWPATRQLEDWVYDAQAGALGLQLHYCDAWVAETRNHGESRLCHLWKTDPTAMRERCMAYVLVFGHARDAGIAVASPQMQQFVRSLFWMARNAAAYGLPDQARQLFELARGNALSPGWDYRLFALATTIFGWRAAARLADRVDKLRR
jgi:glycosyltransferase involved in cell wall biosynthesis